MRVSSNYTLRQNPLPADVYQDVRFEAGYSSAYAGDARLR